MSYQNQQAQVVAEELGITINKIDMNLSSFIGVKDTSENTYREVRFQANVYEELTQEQVKELGESVNNRCLILRLLRSSYCNILNNSGMK